MSSSNEYKSADPFRKQHRQLNDDDHRQMDEVKAAAETLLDRIERMVPEGREKDIALTKLLESIMWATKGITT